MAAVGCHDVSDIDTSQSGIGRGYRDVTTMARGVPLLGISVGFPDLPSVYQFIGSAAEESDEQRRFNGSTQDRSVNRSLMLISQT